MSLHALQFAALGDPIRCRIVELLALGPMPVHALAERFPVSRPAVSRHLRVLREAGIVREEKTGRENLYALRREQLSPTLEWIGRILPAEPQQPQPVKPKPAAPPDRPARAGQMELDL